MRGGGSFSILRTRTLPCTPLARLNRPCPRPSRACPAADNWQWPGGPPSDGWRAPARSLAARPAPKHRLLMSSSARTSSNSSSRMLWWYKSFARISFNKFRAQIIVVDWISVKRDFQSRLIGVDFSFVATWTTKGRTLLVHHVVVATKSCTTIRKFAVIETV